MAEQPEGIAAPHGADHEAFVGAFDRVDPDDFHDPARLSAKLAPLTSAFDAAIEGRLADAADFDLDAFVDRCVRGTEATYAVALDEHTQLAPTAVLACQAEDVMIPGLVGEPLLAYLDRLHEELVARGACAAFVVKAASVGARTAATRIGNVKPPAVYFYCESRAGRVVHGFWRVTGVGPTARLTECYKLRSDQPNQVMHRIISGPQ